MFTRHKSVVFCALLGAFALATAGTARGAVVSVAIPSDLVPGTLPLADPGINTLWDVNGDGTNDFNFTFRQPQTSGGVDWQANVFPISGSGVITTYDAANDLYNATRLTLGTTIGSTNSFTGAPVQGTLGESFAGTSGGQFNATTGYLGFRFVVGANTYYGWMMLSTARSGGIDFMSAAYENTPGMAIAAERSRNRAPGRCWSSVESRSTCSCVAIGRLSENVHPVLLRMTRCPGLRRGIFRCGKRNLVGRPVPVLSDFQQ